jgi:predicted nucleotidyltransferase
MRAISDPADAAKFAAEVIRRHFPDPAYRIFLFGSRATGAAAERSDIDIGIEGPAPQCPASRLPIQDELEEPPTLYTIDVVDFRTRGGAIPQGRARAHPVVTKAQSLRADLERAIARLAEAARRFRAVLVATAVEDG